MSAVRGRGGIARRSERPLTFVQIGSCEGKANEPLHEVLRSCQRSGILVEPMPVLFLQLVANYQGVAGLRWTALLPGRDRQWRGDHDDLFRRPPPRRPDWVVQLTSFDRDVVMSHSAEVEGSSSHNRSGRPLGGLRASRRQYAGRSQGKHGSVRRR